MRSSLLSIFTLTALLSSAAGVVHAEIEASLDLRLVQSNGRRSFNDAGLGKLRFGADDEGLQLGRARLAWRGSPGGNWHANVDLSAWTLHDHNRIDVTEAWLEWRPVPLSVWRSNLKLGAFYPPVSLEHRGPGWSNPYTISSSALNTWIGEEFRTIGAAYEIEHLGTAEDGRFDFGFNAAAYGWNDPAGIIIALRGFALHDRQTPLFGRIGSYAGNRPDQRVLFSEIDNRPGYYAGAYVRHDSGLELRTLHYDNRGDPSAFKPSIDDYAWNTGFNSVGLRFDGARKAAFIAQWLRGHTDVGPNAHDRWKFETSFVMVAQDLGAHRFALRYDDFQTQQTAALPPRPLGVQHGHAWTIGWTWRVQKHVELAAEWLDVRSNYNKRVALGELPDAREDSMQLALRLSL
jgi:hypothetical protein